MVRLFLIFFISFVIFSCGGGGGSSKNTTNSNLSYESYIISAKNFKGSVGFELIISLDNYTDNYTLELLGNLSNWNIKSSLQEKKIKILAFNPDLSPINVNDIDLIKVKIPKDTNITSIYFKAVDDFGNPIEKTAINIRLSGG